MKANPDDIKHYLTANIHAYPDLSQHLKQHQPLEKDIISRITKTAGSM
jgi:hypothetical protein